MYYLYNTLIYNNMTKQEFMQFTNEDPVDIFGEDWENILKEWDEIN